MLPRSTSVVQLTLVPISDNKALDRGDRRAKSAKVAKKIFQIPEHALSLGVLCEFLSELGGQKLRPTQSQRWKQGRGLGSCLPHGKTKRNNSPSSACAQGSWAGNLPLQKFHAAGISRVCAVGTSIHPCAVSSRRKTEKAGAEFHACNDSDFHSNKLAASFSVSDSHGSRLRIHSVRTN